MCEIDWTALGAWAAVVIALGIAVEDKITRRIRLRSERAALASFIAADLDLAKDRLEHLLAYIAPEDGNDCAISDALLFRDAGLRRKVATLGADIDAPAIREGSGRLQAFDAGTIRAIASSATMLRAIRQGTKGFDNMLEEDEDKFSELMAMLRVTVRSVIRLVEKTEALLGVHE